MPTRLRIELFPADLAVSIGFWTGVLDFKLLQEESDYAFLRRDDMLVGLVTGLGVGDRDARRPPTGVEIVVVVDDLDAEHDRVAALWPLTDALTARPWGLRDFRLLDPDGYYLRITEVSTDGGSAG